MLGALIVTRTSCNLFLLSPLLQDVSLIIYCRSLHGGLYAQVAHIPDAAVSSPCHSSLRIQLHAE